MNTQRYDQYRACAEGRGTSDVSEQQVYATLASAEATLLVAEQLEAQLRIQKKMLVLNQEGQR